jgi:hypothetical protein
VAQGEGPEIKLQYREKKGDSCILFQSSVVSIAHINIQLTHMKLPHL